MKLHYDNDILIRIDALLSGRIPSKVTVELTEAEFEKFASAYPIPKFDFFTDEEVDRLPSVSKVARYKNTLVWVAA